MAHTTRAVSFGERDFEDRDAILTKLNPVTYLVRSNKFWTFDSPSGSSGTFYFGGHYQFGSSHDNFSPSITFGTAGKAQGAHFFVVAGASGGISPPVIRVSGVSVSDDGTINAADTEDISLSQATVSGDYLETSKKWVSRVTVETVSGVAINCNYGFVKYWDNFNTDFTIKSVEATWLGGATDANPNIAIIHHKPSGWTYNSGAAPTPPSPIAELDDLGALYDGVVNGEPGAWKRTGLDVDVSGSTDEGTIIQVSTTANKTFEIGTVEIQIEVLQSATLL